MRGRRDDNNLLSNTYRLRTALLRKKFPDAIKSTGRGGTLVGREPLDTSKRRPLTQLFYSFTCLSLAEINELSLPNSIRTVLYFLGMHVKICTYCSSIQLLSLFFFCRGNFSYLFSYVQHVFLLICFLLIQSIITKISEVTTTTIAIEVTFRHHRLKYNKCNRTA